MVAKKIGLPPDTIGGRLLEGRAASSLVENTLVVERAPCAPMQRRHAASQPQPTCAGGTRSARPCHGRAGTRTYTKCAPHSSVETRCHVRRASSRCDVKAPKFCPPLPPQDLSKRPNADTRASVNRRGQRRTTKLPTLLFSRTRRDGARSGAVRRRFLPTHPTLTRTHHTHLTCPRGGLSTAARLAVAE